MSGFVNGTMVNGIFYEWGKRYRFKVDGEIHDCIWTRAHVCNASPEIMTLRVKSLSGKKYAINSNHIQAIRRVEA